MQIVSAWVVPHAPVLVPGVSRRGGEAGGPPAVSPSGMDAVIVVSPHGTTTGVYRRASGGLDGFGARGYARSAASDESLADTLARAWGTPLIDEPADHGAVVPLWWLRGEVPVVACTFAEVTGPGAPGEFGAVARAAESLSEALSKTEPRRAVAVVASAHLSAGLTPGAPLGELPGAREFDDTILGVLRDDLAGLLDVPPDAWRAAGSCGLGPLATLARLCPGRAVRNLRYSCPFGVGYLTAELA